MSCSGRSAHDDFRLLNAVVERERWLLKGKIVTLNRVHSGWSVGSGVTDGSRVACKRLLLQ